MTNDLNADHDDDSDEDTIFTSRYCEDAPCCGCCGTNLYTSTEHDYNYWQR